MYRDDLAAVTRTRTVDLDRGPAQLTMEDLSPALVPGSLDLHAPDLTVRQQRVLPWPVSRARLLRAAVGSKVTLVRTPQTGEPPVTRRARLLAVAPDIVVDVNGRIETDPPGRVALKSLPEEFRESPTAVFDVASAQNGEREVRLRYLSRGLSWDAVYVARWDREAQTLDLTGRARIASNLARPIAGDHVTLVAGRVPTVQGERPRPRAQRTEALAARAASASDSGRPDPKPRADLRLYPLPEPLRLPAKGTVSRRLLGAAGVPVETRYRLTGLATNRPHINRPEDRRNAELRLVVPDTREAGLDAALPGGVVRVYDGDLFRGAQRISDTPLGTRLSLDLGAAVAVTATAARTDYDKLSRDSYDTGRRITLNNAKDRAVTVRVVGNFRGDWEILAESAEHTRNDGGDPVWRVEVPAQLSGAHAALNLDDHAVRQGVDGHRVAPSQHGGVHVGEHDALGGDLGQVGAQGFPVGVRRARPFWGVTFHDEQVRVPAHRRQHVRPGGIARIREHLLAVAQAQGLAGDVAVHHGIGSDVEPRHGGVLAGREGHHLQGKRPGLAHLAEQALDRAAQPVVHSVRPRHHQRPRAPPDIVHVQQQKGHAGRVVAVKMADDHRIQAVGIQALAVQRHHARRAEVQGYAVPVGEREVKAGVEPAAATEGVAAAQNRQSHVAAPLVRACSSRAPP